MGAIGAQLGVIAGGAAGGWLGSQIMRKLRLKKNKYIDFETMGASAGAALGGLGGAMLPFKNGGKIKSTGRAYMHEGEFVLPKGVKPTKSQVKRVRKRGGVVV
jgi:hypothetical protein